MADRNYTLPRGKLFFAPYAAGTTTPTGERFIGNVPELNLNFETEELDHYSSTGGIREKDDSIILEVNRTGSLITDDIQPENVAIVFLGSASTLTVVGATVDDEEFTIDKKDRYYQLGETDANPAGARGLGEYSVGVDIELTNETGTTTYVAGTDYVIDMDLARLYIPATSTVTEGAVHKVSYKTKNSTRTRVVSGGTQVQGKLRYVADNPKGANMDYVMPYAKLMANGDFALVGGDEWQQISLNIEILKKEGMEAVYCDGRPVFA